MPYISAARLSQLLALKPKTISLWPKSEKPPIVKINRRQHYRYDDVDAWLANRAVGFKAPPTLAQLLSGELVLIRREDAGRLIVAERNIADITNYVARRIAKGALPAIRLQDTTRLLSLQGVESFIANLERAEDSFTIKQMRHILGAPLQTLNRAINRGDLAVVRDIQNVRHRRITRSSLLNALTYLLPASNGISAEDWLDDRLNSTEPLVSVKKARLSLGMSDRAVRVLLNNGTLRHIRSFEGTVFFVSPDSVAAYAEQGEPLSLTEKAHIFGTDYQQIQRWQQKGYLDCPLHAHSDPEQLYQGCMAAILQSLCGPKVYASRWITMRLQNPNQQLLNERQASVRLGMSVDQCAHRFTYITTPSGRRMFVASDIEAGRSKRL